MLTPFPEADGVLRDVVDNARAVLGSALVGVYLEGSFALDAGDMFSDLDFVAVSAVPLDPEQEHAVRAFHHELPTRPQHWAQHVEGSYAPLSDVQELATVGRDWLFIDHGQREMAWDPHGNDMVHRWVLANHGIAVSGPPARELFPPVPADALRAESSYQLTALRAGLAGWIDPDIAWFQRYLVVNYCRVLFTIVHGAVTSKRAALDWAIDTLDPRWVSLLVAARDERTRGWDVTDRPAPGVIAESLAFAGYCEQWTP